MDDPIDIKTLGLLVRAERERRGRLSLRAAADQAEVPFNTLTRVERAISPIFKFPTDRGLAWYRPSDSPTTADPHARTLPTSLHSISLRSSPTDAAAAALQDWSGKLYPISLPLTVACECIFVRQRPSLQQLRRSGGVARKDAGQTHPGAAGGTLT